jgi:hypothetical protein
MKRTVNLYQLIEQLLMFLLSMTFNALPAATQMIIVGFIKDNLRQNSAILRYPHFYAALLTRKAIEHFKKRKVFVKKRLKQILFQSEGNYKYVNSKNNMVSKREACGYEETKINNYQN